ncbi:hypothetical protein V6N11_075886 [Hibiscus sabdariffa]|uniref:Sugar transporter n=1 Tax=Hibiscus sabdariffa TaxID=183260 RepID=A0ABR2Q4L0_9ROSI
MMANLKKGSSDSSLFGNCQYQCWALALILFFAFWSMFTGTITLRWSAGNLNRLSDVLDSPFPDDLDALEMEEREKVVKHMWDVYTKSRRIRLPRFWQEAFEAAYEELISDVPGVRDDAITEIAKMPIPPLDLYPPSPRIQSTKPIFVLRLSLPSAFSGCKRTEGRSESSMDRWIHNRK